MKLDWKKFFERDSVWCAVVFLLTAASFLPSLGGTEAISDDIFYLLKAERPLESLRDLWEPVIGLPSPLTVLSFRLDRILFDSRRLLGAHAVNVLFHAFNGVLFYLFSREFIYRRSNGQEVRFSPCWAGIAALCFTLHPQRVESVAWIAERKDVLAMFFGLSSLLFFFRGVKKERPSFAAPLLFCLSLFSKPLWISFLVPAAALIWFEKRRFPWKFMLKFLAPFFLVTAAFMFWQMGETLHTLKVTASSSGVPLAFKIETILHNYGLYFLKILVPGELYPVYPYYNPQTDGRWICFVPLLLAMVPFLARKKELRDPVLYGWLPALVTFAAVLAPMAGFSRIGNTDFADRYSYLPSIFILIPVMMQLKAVPPRSALAAWFPVLGILYTAGLWNQTRKYLPCWKDNLAYVVSSMRHHAPNFNSVFSRGCQLFFLKKYPETLELIQKKLPEFSHYPEDFNNCIRLYKLGMAGLILFEEKQPERGIQYLNTIYMSPHWHLLKSFQTDFMQKIFSTGAQYHLNRFKDRNAAENLYLRCAELTDFHSPGYGAFYSGMAAVVKESYAAAIPHFQRAVQLMPHDPRCRQNLEYCIRKVKGNSAK